MNRLALGTLVALLAIAWVDVQTVAAKTSADLGVGDMAPEFSAKDDQDKEWKSTDYVGKKILVVYFYPADMTGGCTAQACGYRDNVEKLADKDVVVVGVSGDTVSSHQAFKKVHDLNFTLLADTDGSVANKFGVPITEGAKTVEKMIDDVMHVLNRNVTAKRWTFVIGKDGKIAYKDDAVKAQQVPEKILAVVNGLK